MGRMWSPIEHRGVGIHDTEDSMFKCLYFLIMMVILLLGYGAVEVGEKNR